jgi:hypothetical protein
MTKDKLTAQFENFLNSDLLDDMIAYRMETFLDNRLKSARWPNKHPEDVEHDLQAAKAAIVILDWFGDRNMFEEQQLVNQLIDMNRNTYV